MFDLILQGGTIISPKNPTESKEYIDVTVATAMSSTSRKPHNIREAADPGRKRPRGMTTGGLGTHLRRSPVADGPADYHLQESPKNPTPGNSA